MPKGKIIVLMGSEKDYEFASRIQRFIKEEGFAVECEYNVASAHRTPQKLLNDLKGYEESESAIVYVTVAGLSDALSGVVAGFVKRPVIACPPDLDKYGWAKAFSSAIMPKGVAVALIPEPENAALAAVKMLALHDETLYERLEAYKRKVEERVYEAAKRFKIGPGAS